MKKRKKTKPLPTFISVSIYGIWSKDDKRLIFVSLNQEDVETEYDLEDYTEETHVVVCLLAYYNISSLESQDPSASP